MALLNIVQSDVINNWTGNLLFSQWFMWSRVNNNPNRATLAQKKIETMETEYELDTQDDSGSNTLNHSGTVQISL